jgi:micrococcal nuclease
MSDHEWTYPRCRALKVHDGDTVKLDIDCGLSTHRIVWVRLAHINAPELKHEKGTAVRERAALLLAAEPLTVTTIKDRTEKYGRYLARIVNADGIDVGQQLLDEGLATPYESGRR